ncbi:hypothetical protein PG994_002235 [Apiospora phragmitis]|uniref:Protein kinase domain-containing protein n=1 Tax=Apiospora phragmitis TaxID=2905665 RepID=A0ABR1WVR7_9PEZI
MLEYDEACIPEPKLHQFDTGGEPLVIDFIEQLGKGVHAFVWKVRINGNIYALKIVSDPSGTGGTWLRSPTIGGSAAFLLSRFSISLVNVVIWSDEYYGVGRKRYAIVKELLDFEYAKCKHEEMARVFGSPKLVVKGLKGLKTIHNLGIFVGDIKQDNFSWGKYVDFSRPWTAPHPFATGGFSDEGPPYQDACSLEDIVHCKRGWNDTFPNNKVWDRLLPNEKYLKKLRSSKGLSRDQIELQCLEYWSGRPEAFSYEKARKLYRRTTVSERKTKPFQPWKCGRCQTRSRHQARPRLEE